MAKTEPRDISYGQILEEALRAREQFLKEQPHLQDFQDEIDRMLEKTVGFENRMSVLSFMMEAKLYELSRAFSDIRDITVRLQGFLGTVKTLGAAETGTPDKLLDYCVNSECYVN